MSSGAPTQRYSSLSIALHWGMLLLIAAVYACIELRELYPRGSDIREGLKAWHFMLGLTVLALVVVRIIARLVAVRPRIVPELSAWQAALSRMMHFALYVFMVGLPIAGWVILSAGGKTIPFYGLELPALVAENKALAGQVKDLHETVGVIGYYLIGLHALAALIHHYIVKDNTLLRLLPGRR